jgi:Na+/phosphate symporter
MNQVADNSALESRMRKSVGLFDSRPRLRAVAVSLWASFIGGCLFFIAFLAHLFETTTPPTLSDQTLVFFAIWLLAFVPAIIASVLTMPPPTDELGDGSDD